LKGVILRSGKKFGWKDEGSAKNSFCWGHIDESVWRGMEGKKEPGEMDRPLRRGTAGLGSHF
jgi:hypothetical protein